MRLYLDTSAAAKLVVLEPESSALVAYCNDDAVILVSTDLLETELRRTAIRQGIAQQTVTGVLDRVTLHDIPRNLYAEAGLLAGPALRTLDAIHIAGAIRLDVDAALIYDKRMREAAVDLGLHVHAPGDGTWVPASTQTQS